MAAFFVGFFEGDADLGETPRNLFQIPRNLFQIPRNLFQIPRNLFQTPRTLVEIRSAECGLRLGIVVNPYGLSPSPLALRHISPYSFSKSPYSFFEKARARGEGKGGSADLG